MSLHKYLGLTYVSKTSKLFYKSSTKISSIYKLQELFKHCLLIFHWKLENSVPFVSSNFLITFKDIKWTGWLPDIFLESEHCDLHKNQRIVHYLPFPRVSPRRARQAWRPSTGQSQSGSSSPPVSLQTPSVLLNTSNKNNNTQWNCYIDL